jgi:hypothetical protein
VLHVGLTCDPDVLIERGLDEFGEPRPGVLWQLTVFERVSDRDLVIDTTELSTAQIVDVILAAVARRLPLERP